jgi:hypothetical protein
MDDGQFDDHGGDDDSGGWPSRQRKIRGAAVGRKGGEDCGDDDDARVHDDDDDDDDGGDARSRGTSRSTKAASKSAAAASASVRPRRGWQPSKAARNAQVGENKDDHAHEDDNGGLRQTNDDRPDVQPKKRVRRRNAVQEARIQKSDSESDYD